MVTKPEMIGVRLSSDQKQRLLAVAAQIGNDGNITAGLRWCIKHAPVERLEGKQRRGGPRVKNK